MIRFFSPFARFLDAPAMTSHAFTSPIKNSSKSHSQKVPRAPALTYISLRLWMCIIKTWKKPTPWYIKWIFRGVLFGFLLISKERWKKLHVFLRSEGLFFFSFLYSSNLPHSDVFFSLWVFQTYIKNHKGPFHKC